MDDPQIDIAVSMSPSTCAPHLDKLGRPAGIHDLAETATTMSVYAFSVLGP